MWSYTCIIGRMRNISIVIPRDYLETGTLRTSFFFRKEGLQTKANRDGPEISTLLKMWGPSLGVCQLSFAI